MWKTLSEIPRHGFDLIRMMDFDDLTIQSRIGRYPYFDDYMIYMENYIQLL